MEQLVSHGTVPHTVMLVCEDEKLLNLCAEDFCVGVLSNGAPSEAKQSIRARYENGALVDVHHVYKDTPTTISVAAVRSMIQMAHRGSIDFDMKIFVVHDSECLLEVAQNAFLKTLEEPPAGVFFLLLAKSTSSILETIKSRCLILPIQKPFAQGEDFPIAFEVLYKVAAVCEGDSFGVFSLSEALSKDKNLDLRAFLQALFEFFCDLCLFSLTRDSKTLRWAYERSVVDMMRSLAGRITKQNYDNILAHISRALDSLEANVSKQLLLEAMLLKIQEELCKK